MISARNVTGKVINKRPLYFSTPLNHYRASALSSATKNLKHKFTHKKLEAKLKRQKELLSF